MIKLLSLRRAEGTRYHKQAGLSLLEMLVVIVLISMVSTLMMQGFGYMLGLYHRINSQQHAMYQELMAANWFSQTTETLMASKIPGESLKGNKTQFEATTFSPLIGEGGQPTVVSWQLKKELNDVALIYKEAGKTVETFRWQGSLATFSYLDNDDRWHDEWPLDKESLSLPQQVKLIVDGGGEQEQVIVSIKTRLTPYIPLDEVLYGR